MKKLISIIACAVIATAAAVAQPRAIGGYAGMMSQGVEYQHSFSGGSQFLEVFAGTDFAIFNGQLSGLAGASYNFVFANFPKSAGQFNLWAGPGAIVGYGVTPLRHGKRDYNPYVDLMGTFGFDFTFNCHVMLFAKISPAVGICFGPNDDDGRMTVGVEFARALYGAIPTIGVAYAF